MIEVYSDNARPRPLFIKALDEDEYSQAESDGYVYGSLKRASVIFVYVYLGKEVKYDPPEGVKPQEGRKFTRCKCLLALTEEDINDGKFIEKAELNADVILYYS